ncbi:M14 family zinc carboxypeptidase [Massilia sp. Root351]|uniref:M14 family zinc carboxypeptidase n=1 Tax=Massilia sp. Root351 TaxID=1736522 RepID=UPI000A4B0C2F|nr:M14 family zinc carboxypeptidase [Massilia sp. Root351]
MVSHIISSIPDYRALPTVRQMQAQTRALAALQDPNVQVRRIGTSREGQPIELISIGSARRSALVVGTPHPNEAIGCLTTEYLIDRLRHDERLRKDLGYTWHFIRSIEPDGLRRNEAWLDTPHDVGAYLRGFFRPALQEQAEYSFPLAVDDVHFERSTPENHAWQEAIALTRPDLMVSLHNAEHGGAFHILSHPHHELAAQLTREAADFDIPLDTLGELGAGLTALSPGVFQTFDVAAMLRSVPAERRAAIWTGGQSSFGYTAPGGTFCLTVEVPHWREALVPANADRRSDLAEALEPATGWFRTTLALLERYLPMVEPRTGPNSEAGRYLEALREARTMAQRQLGFLAAPPPLAMSHTEAMAQRRAMRLFTLRPVAMMARLASMVSAPAAMASASGILESALADRSFTSGLVPVPLRTSVGLQVRATLTTAAAMAHRVPG